MSSEFERTDGLIVVVEIPGVAALDTSTVVGPSMPRDGHVTGVQIVPRAAVTFNATNFATITVQNKGPLGSGSTAVASRTWSAVSSVAGTKETAVLNATPANLEFKAGDQLIVVHSSAASGLALPAISVIINWLPR